MNLYEIDQEKKEIPDNFADQFSVTMHPYGAAFAWMKTRVVPMGTVVPDGQSVPPETVQITRMTPVHVKMMVFTLFRLIREQEKTQNCMVPIPESTLKDMNIEPSEWAAFWGEAQNEIAPAEAPAEIVPIAPVAPVEAAPAVAGPQPQPA